MELNKDNIVKYVKGGHLFKDVHPNEVDKFIQLCTARKLDPFTGDVVVSGFQGKSKNGKEYTKLTYIISVDAVISLARQNPQYAGHQCIFIHKDGTEKKYPFPEKDVVGVMCEVYIKGDVVPVNQTALLSEYGKDAEGPWKSQKSVMLSKCAVVLAHRRALPTQFAGLYGKEEMDKVISENPLDAPPPAATEVQSPEVPKGPEQRTGAGRVAKMDPAEPVEDVPVLKSEKELREEAESLFQELFDTMNSVESQADFDLACDIVVQQKNKLLKPQLDELIELKNQLMKEKGFQRVAVPAGK